MNPVNVPQKVLDGIMRVRDSGLTNMLDRPMVAKLAARMGFEATAAWVRTHTKEYAEEVFHGFAPQRES